MSDQTLSIRIAVKNEIAKPLADAEQLVRRFAGNVRDVNVAIGEGTSTSSIAFGNLWANAITKVAGEVISLGQQVGRLGVNAVQTGVMFNATMQTSKLGIAALASSFGQLTDAQGNVLRGQEAWNASLQISESIQKKLRVAALQTTAQYSDLLLALQHGMGPALRAGFNEDQIVRFTQTVAQSAAAIGLPMQQLGQEIRSLFSGDIGIDSRLANLLFTDIPRDKIKAYVEELQASGKFFEELTGRMSAFAKAGEESANTFTGAFSNLKDAIEQALGEATTDATSQFALQIKELTGEIVQFDAAGNAVFNQEFVGGVQSLAGAFVELTGGLVDFVKEAPHAIQAMKDMAESFRINTAENVRNPLFSNTRHNLFDLLLGNGGTPGVDDISLFNMQQEIGRQMALELQRRNQVALGLGVTMYDEAIGPGLGANLVGRGSGGAAVENAKKLADELEKQRGFAIDIREAYGEFETTAGRLLRIEMQRAEQVEKIRKATMLSPQERADLERMATIIAQRGTSGALIDAALAGFVSNAGAIGGSASQIAGMHADTDLLVGRIVEGFKVGALEIEKSERWKKAAEEFGQNLSTWQRNGAAEAADLIADGLITGGRNAAEIFVSAFQRMTVEGADSLITQLAEMFVGGAITYDTQGNPLVNGQPATMGQAGRLAGLNAAVGFANTGLGAYYAPQASGNDTSILGAGVQGAISNAGGPWGVYGAIIGAIVGSIGAWLGNQAVYDEYKYGIPYLDPRGTYGTITETKNLRPTQIDSMVDAMLDKADQFWNGYAQIFIDAMQTNLLSAVDASQIGGPFQREASKYYLKHFDEWLNGTLPDEIADRFREGMQTIYTSLGMSTEKFEALWQYWDNRDPEQALRFWQGMLSAMTTMKKAFDFFSGGGLVDHGELPIFSTFTTTGQANMASVRNQMAMGFSETLRESDAEILNLANSLEHLTGEAQIRSAQQLAQLMQERMEREKQYYASIIEMIDQTDKAFDAMRRNLTLQGMLDADGNPDQAGQLEYLKEYLDRIKAAIEGASSPDEIAYWQTEFFNTVNQMLGIAGAMGPEQAAALREWLMGDDGFGGVLSIIQDSIKERLAALADSVGQANDDLMEALKPVWDTFLGAIEDAGDVIGGGNPGGGGPDDQGPRGFVPGVESAAEAAARLGAGAYSAAEGVERLALSVVSLADRIDALEFGGGSDDYEASTRARRMGRFA